MYAEDTVSLVRLKKKIGVTVVRKYGEAKKKGTVAK